MRKRTTQTQKDNVRDARKRWPGLGTVDIRALRILCAQYNFSIAAGDLLFLDRRWYVTHAGLLRLAERKRCAGIEVQQVHRFCDPQLGRWVFRATVHTRCNSRRFVGYGDASPSNVSDLVRGAEMRVAETRAVNRALRKTFGIGLCSAEELRWEPRSLDFRSSTQNNPSTNGNNSHRSQPRLRDQLCLLIRKYQLDAGLVKAYAADFCNVPTLRDGSREQVEAFINKLAESAATDRDALICRLNTYARQEEAHS